MVIERDFRKLTPAMQAELRRIAVSMISAGKTRIEAVGVNRRFGGQWVTVAASRCSRRPTGRHWPAQPPGIRGNIG